MATYFEDPIRLVRELKGAPLSIYIVMLFIRTPVENKFLESATGYSDKPISKALAYLERIGYVTRGSSGWILAEGRQLQLEYLQNPSRRNSDSEVLLNTTTTIVENDDSLVEVVSNNDESRRNSDSSSSNLAAFKSHGIGINSRTIKLSKQPWVNPEYIHNHVTAAGPENIGLAIIRMEANEKPPPIPIDHNSVESRLRYLEWEQ